MCDGNCNQGRDCSCGPRIPRPQNPNGCLAALSWLILFWTVVSIALLYSCQATAKPSYDERKQAVLSERKAVRRATERAYEPCLRAGNPPAKCLAEGLKAGEKALANWRSAGHNPHMFSTY